MITGIKKILVMIMIFVFLASTAFAFGGTGASCNNQQSEGMVHVSNGCYVHQDHLGTVLDTSRECGSVQAGRNCYSQEGNEIKFWLGKNKQVPDNKPDNQPEYWQEGIVPVDGGYGVGGSLYIGEYVINTESQQVTTIDGTSAGSVDLSQAQSFGVIGTGDNTALVVNNADGTHNVGGITLSSQEYTQISGTSSQNIEVNAGAGTISYGTEESGGTYTYETDSFGIRTVKFDSNNEKEAESVLSWQFPDGTVMSQTATQEMGDKWNIRGLFLGDNLDFDISEGTFTNSAGDVVGSIEYPSDGEQVLTSYGADGKPDTVRTILTNSAGDTISSQTQTFSGGKLVSDSGGGLYNGQQLSWDTDYSDDGSATRSIEINGQTIGTYIGDIPPGGLEEGIPDGTLFINADGDIGPITFTDQIDLNNILLDTVTISGASLDTYANAFAEGQVVATLDSNGDVESYTIQGDYGQSLNKDYTKAQNNYDKAQTKADNAFSDFESTYVMLDQYYALKVEPGTEVIYNRNPLISSDGKIYLPVESSGTGDIIYYEAELTGDNIYTVSTQPATNLDVLDELDDQFRDIVFEGMEGDYQDNELSTKIINAYQEARAEEEEARQNLEDAEEAINNAQAALGEELNELCQGLSRGECSDRISELNAASDKAQDDAEQKEAEERNVAAAQSWSKYNKGVREFTTVVNYAHEFGKGKPLSNLIFGDIYTKELTAEIDRHFAGTILSENYYESLICKNTVDHPNDIQEGGFAYIETPYGTFQAVASIQGEMTDEGPLLCSFSEDGELTCPDDDMECIDNFCYYEDTEEEAIGKLYKISWGVTAPADETQTPYVDENGIAVTYNIVVCKSSTHRCDSSATNEVRIYEYQWNDNDPLELLNGERDGATIAQWSAKEYDTACIDWGNAPITVAYAFQKSEAENPAITHGGREINDVCVKIIDTKIGQVKVPDFIEEGVSTGDGNVPESEPVYHGDASTNSI